MFHFHLFATLQHPLLHILVLFVLRCTVVIVQLLLPSHVQLFATQWIAAPQASLSLTILQSFPKFMSIASMMPSSHLIFWGPLLFLPSIFPALGIFPMSQRFFQQVSCSHQLTKNTGIPGSASVLPMSIQGWFPLRLTGLMILLSKRLSGMFSNTTVRRHYFFGTLPSLQSSFHNHTWPLGRPWPWLYGPLSSE